MADDDEDAPSPLGPLRSKKFRNNRRLQQCAVTDPAHVRPGDPPSEHVRLIQEALRELRGAQITEERYGDQTAAAILALKSEPPPLITRGTANTIDPITGIGTIRRLDDMLRAKNSNRPKPSPPPVPPPPSGDPTFVLSGKCQVVNERQDNPQAGDMQFADPVASIKSFTTGKIIAPFTVLDDITLQGLMLSAMAAALAISGDTPEDAAARPHGLAMCNRFFNTGGAATTFANGHAISKAMEQKVGYTSLLFSVNASIKREITKQWKAGLVSDAVVAANVRKEAFQTAMLDGALLAIIGGTQGFKFEMCDFTADARTEKVSYRLKAEIYDHFGVDETDINKGSVLLNETIGRALATFFVLQHQRSATPINFAASRFRPFRIIIQSESFEEIKIDTGRK